LIHHLACIRCVARVLRLALPRLGNNGVPCAQQITYDDGDEETTALSADLVVIESAEEEQRCDAYIDTLVSAAILMGVQTPTDSAALEAARLARGEAKWAHGE
jgi:hypothetical protein